MITAAGMQNEARMHGEKSHPRPVSRIPRLWMETFSWCPHHQAWCIHKPSECWLGMPVTNVATQSSDGAQDSATTVWAMAFVALRMDESWLAAGRMYITYYVTMCLSITLSLYLSFLL